MKNFMSMPERTYAAMSVELEMIWYVEADNSYDVIRGSDDLPSIVAVRTIEGEGILHLHNGETLSLTENTVAFVFNEQIKRYYCADGSLWKFYWFRFQTDAIYMPEFHKTYQLTFTANESIRLRECFNTLMSPMYFSANTASAYFCSILSSWIAAIGVKPTRNSAAIEEVLEYISENIARDISISTLAERAKMSERTFRNVFKQYTRLSPKKYIENKRLNAAKELLKTTNMQIKVISVTLGFTDQYYFSRVFKKRFGVPPNAYEAKGASGGDFLQKIE